MFSILPVVLKNFFSRPATLLYPYQTRAAFPGSRGKLTWDAANCDFCGDCARLCPAAAIEVEAETLKVHYEPFRCIYCHTCVEACWRGAIRGDNAYAPAAYSKLSNSYSPDRTQ